MWQFCRSQKMWATRQGPCWATRDQSLRQLFFGMIFLERFSSFWRPFGSPLPPLNYFGWTLVPILDLFLLSFWYPFCIPFFQHHFDIVFSIVFDSRARPIVNILVIPEEIIWFLSFIKIKPKATKYEINDFCFYVGIWWGASWHTLRSFFGTPFCIDC